MSAPLPLCVVGAGSIGMRHVEVALASDAVRLTAVVEPDAARREGLNGMGVRAVAGLEDVPSEVRAAVIATPTPDHHGSGVACLGRGWAVLVEKPTAGTLDDGRALVTAAERLGLPLVTGHHRRCHPFSLAARDSLGGIGELVGVQALWSLRKHNAYYDVAWRRSPGAGPLMTNLSHELDLMHFLLGGIDEVSALVSNARRGMAIEDTGALSLRFEGGALGSVLISDAGASPWSFEAASGENPAIAASGEDYLRIVGTEGALSFPSLTLWERGAPGEIEWSKPLRPRLPAPLPGVDPLAAQLARFAALVAGGEDDVLCQGGVGLSALEMTLATALSAQRGRPVRAGDVPGDYTGQTDLKERA